MNRPPHLRPTYARPGFTLVELTIVILILSILAAIVIPKISAGADESRTSATASTVKNVQTMIQFATNNPQTNPTGDIPATIDPAWFADNSIPVNPWDETYAGARVNVDATATADQTHPASKAIGSNGVFWYNPSNGRFRALIPDQGNAADNMKLYNAVNSTGITAWDQITGG